MSFVHSHAVFASRAVSRSRFLSPATCGKPDSRGVLSQKQILPALQAGTIRFLAMSTADTPPASSTAATESTSLSPRERLVQLSRNSRVGGTADSATSDDVLKLVSELESQGWQGEGSGPLASDEGLRMLNGRWELLFSIPGNASSSRPSTQNLSIAATDGREGNRGRVFQTIDTAKGRVDNKAEGKYFTFRAEAAFVPVTGSDDEVAVTFDKVALQLGPLPEIGIPVSWLGGKGKLRTTFLNEEVRIGRGDKGTLFCLARPEEDL